MGALRTLAQSARTRGRSWQETRARILRDSPYCAECARAGRVRLADEVDHILPIADGGSDEPGNLQPLCAPCHREKTRREAQARALDRKPATW